MSYICPIEELATLSTKREGRVDKNAIYTDYVHFFKRVPLILVDSAIFYLRD